MDNRSMLQKLSHKATLYLKRNSSVILTGFSVVGVVGTGVMVAKATPKAIKLLEEAEHKKGEELTGIEKVKAAGPAYIPSVVVGASTIACVVGANILNKKTQASLTSAYILAEGAYKDYRNKTKEIFGEEADTRIRDAIALDERSDNVGLVPGLGCPDLSGDKILFYDEFGHRYFEATMNEVLNAEYHLNRNLAVRGDAPLNEFYDFLGLDTNSFSDAVSWWYDEFLEGGLMPWIDFTHRTVRINDGPDAGLEYVSIGYIVEPTVDYNPGEYSS